MTNKEQEITWDLTELFHQHQRPIRRKSQLMKQKLLRMTFEKNYRGKIATLDPTSLLSCLRELEAFDVKIWRSFRFLQACLFQLT